MTNRLNPDGSENPDPTPLEIPSGMREPESLENMIRRLVKNEELRNALESTDNDTWEDAEDFIIPEADDFDMSTPYEEVFDPVLERSITPQEFHDRAEHYKALYLAAEEKAHQEMLKSEALRFVRRGKPSQPVDNPQKAAPSSPPPGGRAEGGGGSGKS